MEYVKQWWGDLSQAGIGAGVLRLDRWEIAVANRLSLILALLGGFSLVFGLKFGFTVPTFHLAPFLLLAPLVLLLNTSGFTLLSRLLLSMLPVVWLILTPIAFPAIEFIDILASGVFLAFCILMSVSVLSFDRENWFIAIAGMLAFGICSLLLAVYYGDNQQVLPDRSGLFVFGLSMVVVFPTLAFGLLIKSLFLKALDRHLSERERLMADQMVYRLPLSAAGDQIFVLLYDASGRLMEHPKTSGKIRTEGTGIRHMVMHKMHDLSKWFESNGREGGDSIFITGSGYAEQILRYGRHKVMVGAWISPLPHPQPGAAVYSVVVRDMTDIMHQREEIKQLNRSYREKLEEINQQNQLLNYQQHQIFTKNGELHDKNERISSFNAELEQKVRERTADLESKNRQLAEYAFINSHVLRGPLSTLMGLLNLVRYSKLSEEEMRLFDYMKVTAGKLDEIVTKINDAVSNNSELNRKDLYDSTRPYEDGE